MKKSLVVLLVICLGLWVVASWKSEVKGANLSTDGVVLSISEVADKYRPNERIGYYIVLKRSSDGLVMTGFKSGKELLPDLSNRLVLIKWSDHDFHDVECEVVEKMWIKS